MASANALTDDVALSLFQNIREGMKNGRISDLNTAQSEIEAAIAELSSIRPPVTVPTDVVEYVTLLAIPPHQLMFFTQQFALRNWVAS